jgi:dipeptidase E
VLLISNSTLYGSGYLDHAESEIRDFLGDVGSVLFVPYALYDRDAYAAQARDRFQKMGYDLASIHSSPSPQGAVAEADAVFIGGGNTFRLLKALYDFGILDPIRDRVNNGMPYIGSSAGFECSRTHNKNDQGHANPTTAVIRCAGPGSFSDQPALSRIPIRIRSTWERRRRRGFCNFSRRNDTPVAGLREGAMVRIENGSTTLKGSSGATNLSQRTRAGGSAARRAAR